MVNQLRGEVKIDLGGKEYVTRLTIDSIIRLEEKEGESLIKMVSRLSDADMTTAKIVSILHLALRGGTGKDFTESEVKKIVWESGLANSMKAVGEILSASLTPESFPKGNVEAG